MGRGRWIPLLIASSLVVGACGSDGSPTAADAPDVTGDVPEAIQTVEDAEPLSPPVSPPTTEGTSPEVATTEIIGSRPTVCDRGNTTDCTVAVFVFDEPLPLDVALAQLDGWLVLAVFRAEPACVRNTSAFPSPDDPPERPSWFAYVDAEGIEPRVRSNPGTPPISGGFISQAAWDHFVLEWKQTELENALVFAAVVHTLSETTVGLVDLPSVVDVTDIEHYRRDAYDPNFPGELYVRGHRVPDEFGIDRNDHDCDVGDA